MADTLRDLVVNLSLDSDNFSRNIKSINSQIREAESEFKAAGAGVSGFEGTLEGAQAKAEMLAQKVELQAKAVQQYEKALSAATSKLQASYSKQAELTKSLDEAKAKYAEIVEAEGENSDAARAQAEAIKKLEGQLASANRAVQTAADGVSKATTNLNNAKGALAGTQNQLKEATKEAEKQASAWTKAGKALDDFSKKASSVGQSATKVGNTLTATVTAPIAAVGAAAVAAFNEVDNGLDIIVTKTGASGKQLESLTGSFEHVFGNLPVSAEEAATAVGEVNTRFGLTEKALEDVSGQFLKFAKINGADLNSSIDGVDKLMTKFGVDASRVSEVLGTMTKAGQDTGISMNTIISSLQSNGEALKDVGMDLGESIQLLAQFEANGVDAASALAAMKKAVQSAAASGKDAASVFNNTINAIKNAKTETEALTLATQLFGAKGAAEMAAAIREGRLNVDELGVTMSKYADVVEKTFDATQDLPDEMTKGLNQLKLAGNELGKTLMSQLAPAVTSLLESARGLVEGLKQMDESSKQRLVRLAAIAAAIGPITSLSGKLISAIGTVTGLLGKFSTAVGAAGGGFKGLMTVIGSSPATWLALAAAVAYGTYKLIDYASGAKAAREALEGMNKAAEGWKNNNAETLYSESQGLKAFSLSTEDFTRNTATGIKWLTSLTQEWADELAESDETVDGYISSWKEMTESTRSGLKQLAQQASEAGYTNLYEDLQNGVKELDAMDLRVNELLKKRKESFLTAQDIQELNDLIYQRQQIEVRYKLVDESTGFDKIQTQVNAALEKTKTNGADTGQIYKDALVASAEGMAAVNKQLSDEYDQRYALIQLMEGEENSAERQAKLSELNAWYAHQRTDAGRDYARLMGDYMSHLLSGDKIKDTNDQLAELYKRLASYDPNDSTTATALSEITKELDESTITEYYAQMTQLQSLLDQGLSTQEIEDLTGIDASGIEDAFSRLESIKNLLDSMNADELTEPLRSMFGDSLTEEVLKIATDLDMTGAIARWKEFAENPGSDVFTKALVTEYGEQPGGADKTGLAPKDLLAYVKAFAKQQGFDDDFDDPEDLIAKVKEYAKQQGFTGDFDDPTNLLAYVLAYAKAAGFKSDFDDPSGLLAKVKAYAKEAGFEGDFDSPEGLIAQVLAYGKAQGWNGNFDDPTGLTAQVLAYAKASGWNGSFDDPAGLLAYVLKYAKDQNWDGSFDGPTGMLAYIKSYAKALGFDGSFDSPEGLVALVSAYAKAQGWTGNFDNPADLIAQVKAYAKAQGWKGDFDNPADLLAYVAAYAKAVGWTGNFDNPTGLVAEVAAYARAQGFNGDFDSPAGLQALVSAYAKASGWDGAFDSPEGLMAEVVAYAKAQGFTGDFDNPAALLAYVDAYAKSKNWSSAFDAPEGLVALVTAYAKAQGFSGDFEGPEGLSAFVSAYAKMQGFNNYFASPEDLLAKVKAYAKAQGFTGEFDGPAQLMAYVDAYAKSQGWKGDFEAPSGILAYVSAYAKAAGFVSSFDGPTVTSKVTLSDLDAETIKNWKAANGSKVTLAAPVSASVGLTFGPGWQAQLQQMFAAGMLEVYGTNGLPLPVTPEVLQQLTAKSIIIGVDENGVYHVSVRPEWADSTKEDAEEAAKALQEAAQETHGLGWGMKDADTLSEMVQSMIRHYEGSVSQYKGGNPLYDAAGWLARNVFGPIGITRSDITDAYMDTEQAQEYANAIMTIVDAMKNGESIDAETLSFVEDAQKLFETMDELRSLGEDPQNYDLLSAVRNALTLEGIDVSDTTVDETLAKIIADYKEAKKLKDELLAEEKGINDADTEAAAAKLAEVMEQINAAHQEERMRDELAAMDDARDNLTDSLESVSATVAALLEYQEAGGALTDAQKKLLSTYAQAVDELNLVDEAKELGLAVTGGWNSGIAAGSSAVINAMVSLARESLAAAKNELGIESPSRVFRDEVGKQIMAGIGVGVTRETRHQADIIRNAARYLTGEAAAGVSLGGGGLASNTYNTDASISFAGATFQIRDQQDIYGLAREIAALTRRQLRGGGMK